MNTTLDIDDDVLRAGRELARVRGASAGRVITELLRQSFRKPSEKLKHRNGVPQITPLPGGELVTTAMVNRWLNEEP